MIKIFSDFCLLRIMGYKYMLIEELDHDESGDLRINIISMKELSKWK